MKLPRAMYSFSTSFWVVPVSRSAATPCSSPTSSYSSSSAAAGERIVGVAPELGGKVERHRQARGAVLDQVVEALVGLLGAGVARVLAHRPLALAVHLAVHAAGERVLARLAQPLLELGRDVLRVVEGLDLDPGVGEDALVLRADDGGDGGLVLVLGGH